MQAITQVPPEQNCPAGQARPHMPQLAGSVGSSLQPEGQLVCPGRQGETHWPFTHTSPMAQAGSQVMGTSGTTMSGSSTSVGAVAGRRIGGRRAAAAARAARWRRRRSPRVVLPSRPAAATRAARAHRVRTAGAAAAGGGVRCSRQPSAAPAITAHINIRNTSVSFLMASPRSHSGGEGPAGTEAQGGVQALPAPMHMAVRTHIRPPVPPSQQHIPAAQPIFTHRAVCARVS